MEVKLQVVTSTEEGQETTRESAGGEQQDLTPEAFGLSLAEGTAVLQALHESVVEWQMHACLQQPHACPHCGKVRRSQGIHHPVLRTACGTLPVASPRLYHGPCHPSKET
jgi:hypothetical protein